MSDVSTLNNTNTVAIDASEPRKRGKKPTSFDILKLAKAAGECVTKKEARETLHSAGLVATPLAIEKFFEAIDFIQKAQASRAANRIQKRLGHVPKIERNTTLVRNPVLLPQGTPKGRLDAKRRRAVAATANTMLRHGASGGHSMKVKFALNASDVNYTVEMKKNYNTYRGNYKGWAANEDHHCVAVPRDWRIRVERRGLANLDGLMTLDAHQLINEKDVQVYAATWARQGQGFNVNVDRGYIARLEGEHYHADSAQAAVAGVRRKAKLAGAPKRSVFSPYALSIDAFVKRYIQQDITVFVSDATESGSCDFGIRSWCEFVGLDYQLGHATMSQVLEKFCIRPQEEVRRAVVFAVRRYRSQLRALAH